MTIPKLLQALLLLTLIPATAYAVAESTRAHPSQVRDSPTLSSLSIVADGTASDIGGKPEARPDDVRIPVMFPIAAPRVQTSQADVQSQTANVTAQSTIQVQNSGVLVYNVTGGTLRIGTTTYALVNGTGIFNQHSFVVVVHATVTSGDTTSMLILIGWADGAFSTVGQPIEVTFTSPQSKLAGQFFLDLKGTLTVS